MKIMDKALTASKRELINRPKIPPNGPKIISPNCLLKPSPKVWDFDEKCLDFNFYVTCYVGSSGADYKTK